MSRLRIEPALNGNNVFMVHPAGFEPAAFRSGGERSIRLSYGCALQSNTVARNLGPYLASARR